MKNKEHLKHLFNEYIRNFERFNSDEHSEYMKWEFADALSKFDLQTNSLVKDLKRLKKISSVLIDGRSEYPFAAIITYAEHEPDTVRELFAALFAEDNGDFSVRQKKIDRFIEKTEELRQKYDLGDRSKNNQKSAMAFMFFRDPDHHYLYKANQAYRFAECVEFYDDWGAMMHFDLKTYHRMCDWLVDEIKNYPPLLETNASRYEMFDHLHPDKAYHILAFDVIYSSQVYGFYRGMDIKPIDAASRRLNLERIKRAGEYAEKLEAAEEAKEKLKAGKEFILEQFCVGARVKHKAWKFGVIEEISGGIIRIHFESLADKKNLVLPQAVTDGFLTSADPEIAERLKEYISVLKLEKRIERDYKEAFAGYEKYAEYLD